ncbi:MAG: hypothetical protein ACJ763_09980 [Bdellovibrionia bacterium]
MSKGSEAKKEGHDQQQHSTPKADTKAKGAPGGVAGKCVATGCKKDSKQFEFCSEHYDHFKFGLIKKSGQQVPDYEKKFEHYQAHLKRRGVQKAA